MTQEKTPREVLMEARLKISDPSHWTRGAFARTSSGALVSPTGPQATCWCAKGAIISIQGKNAFRLTIRESIRILETVVGKDLTRFNDTSMHAQVLKAFDRAINLSE